MDKKFWIPLLIMAVLQILSMANGWFLAFYNAKKSKEKNAVSTVTPEAAEKSKKSDQWVRTLLKALLIAQTFWFVIAITFVVYAWNYRTDDPQKYARMFSCSIG